tara:strand:+ start:16158 stop:17123 length:966 start_codon:yes stop_codon:yes gene_type:complete
VGDRELSTIPDWSVVIPTWNGRHLLEEALTALDRQSLRSFEVIIVDDSSDDDTVEWIRGNRPRDVVIELPGRKGLAVALNRGIESSNAPYIALLNNDAVPDVDWLMEFDNAFRSKPEISFLASRIRLYDDPSRLHAAGDTYSRSGLPGNRGVWDPDGGEYLESRCVFGACAAAAAYRRELFEDVGLFDEDLVMYCEDVDLDWRAQLAGHRCLYVPGAIVRHRLSATAGGVLASYLVARNRPLVAIMNLPTFVWRRSWWRVVGAQLKLGGQALRGIRGQAARATLAGQCAAIPLLFKAWRKRLGRQKARRASDAYIDSILER